jgi:hypothetical protein
MHFVRSCQRAPCPLGDLLAIKPAVFVERRVSSKIHKKAEKLQKMTNTHYLAGGVSGAAALGGEWEQPEPRARRSQRRGAQAR